MSFRMTMSFRWILLLGGLSILLQPAIARQDEDPDKIGIELKFSTTKEKLSAEQLKSLSNTHLVRPNTELPLSLFVINDSDQARGYLKVYITDTKFRISNKAGDKNIERLKREAIYVGEAHELAEKGKPEAYKFVALQQLKKAPATPAPAADPKAEPVKQPAPAIAKQLFAHIVRVDDAGKEETIGKLQDPIELYFDLSPPSEYLIVTQQSIKYDSVTKKYDLSIKISDRSTKAEEKKPPFQGPPAKVRLDLNKELFPGLDVDSLRDGTFETVVEAGGKDYELAVKGFQLKGKPGPSIISINADGYNRAFIYTTDLSKEQPGLGYSATTLKSDLCRIDLPTHAIPGKPLNAKLEIYSTKKELFPEFKFERTVGGTPELLSRGITTARKEHLGGQLSAEGDLILSSIVQDWEVPINSRGVFGPRDFTLTAKALPGKEQPVQEGNFPIQLQYRRTVIFDATAPEGISGEEVVLGSMPLPKPPAPPKEDVDECTKKEDERQEKKELIAKLKKEGCEPPPGVPLVLPKKGDEALSPEQLATRKKAEAVEIQRLNTPEKVPSRVLVNTKLTFVAYAFDRESDIEKVIFFIGPPPGADNKPTKETKVFEGTYSEGLSNSLIKSANAKDLENKPVKGGFYYFTYEMPDKSGPLDYGVRFINKVGLVTEKVGDLRVVDPPPPPKAKEKPTTGTINGKVSQGDRPQRALAVKLYNDKAEVVLETETDETGSFQFCKVPPGSYRVHAIKQADGGARDTKSVIIKAGDTKETQLELLRR
jgi:hypothetical protein